jgi:uncharacterized phiE125 gp8 family phage protein
MWTRLERISAPAVDPVTLSEVKAQCRIKTADDDAFLGRCVRAARDMIDGPDGIGLAMVAQRWRLSLDCFPSEIFIPMGPVQSIDMIAYVDGDGADQTLAAEGYQWRKERFAARVKPPFGGSWPGARQQFDAVQVEFTAGFPGTEDSPPNLANIPETLRHAMLLLIGHWYENRETISIGNIASEIGLTFSDLISKFRVGVVA